MPVSGFSVSHSAGPLVQCNVAVCAFCHTWWQVSFACIPHGVLSVNLLLIAGIFSSVVTAGDEANGHVGPSSSRWFVQYGLDHVRWLALILGLNRCVDELESK